MARIFSYKIYFWWFGTNTSCQILVRWNVCWFLHLTRSTSLIKLKSNINVVTNLIKTMSIIFSVHWSRWGERGQTWHMQMHGYIHTYIRWHTDLTLNFCKTCWSGSPSMSMMISPRVYIRIFTITKLTHRGRERERVHTTNEYNINNRHHHWDDDRSRGAAGPHFGRVELSKTSYTDTEQKDQSRIERKKTTRIQWCCAVTMGPAYVCNSTVARVVYCMCVYICTIYIHRDASSKLVFLVQYMTIDHLHPFW